MTGRATHGARISRPVLGLLIVTLGLIAFVYWRGERDDAGGQDGAAPDLPASVAMHPIQPGSWQAAPPLPSGPASSAPAGAPGGTPMVDVFPSQTWLPPAPPPPPATAAAAAGPAAQEPPPLPFVVRSLWLDQEGDLYVVLAASNNEFALCTRCRTKGFLRRGDVLLNAWRIEEINSRTVRLLYLPMKRRQQLSLGGVGK